MTNTSSAKTPRFDLGQVVVTRMAYEEMSTAEIYSVLERHQVGDWGIMDPEDSEANEQALAAGDFLHSAYMISIFGRVWVITEADRSKTTVLFPDEAEETDRSTLLFPEEF